MRINHVIKTDQWRCAPQIRPAPHFVVSHISLSANTLAAVTLTYLFIWASVEQHTRVEVGPRS